VSITSMVMWQGWRLQTSEGSCGLSTGPAGASEEYECWLLFPRAKMISTLRRKKNMCRISSERLCQHGYVGEVLNAARLVNAKEP
jgi:hypothetical protein